MKNWVIGFTLASSAVLATPAMADAFDVGDEVTLTFKDLAASRAVSAYYSDGSAVFDRTVSAGRLDWSKGVKTFCIQLLESISVGQSRSFDVVALDQVPEAPPGPGPMGEARATLIRDLYARHYDDVLTATGADANNQSAAFATILWEITHQDSTETTAAGILGDLDFAAGNARFNSSSSVMTFANSWLSGLGGGTGDFLWFSGLRGLSDPTTQDFITVVPGPAGMMALAGLAGIRRPRRRR
jgi:hypothetical protein